MWLAVSKDGTEYISRDSPSRYNGRWRFFWDSDYDNDVISAPKGTIKRLIGRELNWESEPVEITGYDTPDRADNTFVVTQIKE